MNELKWIIWILLFLSVACVKDDDKPLVEQELGIGDRIPRFSVIMDDGSKLADEDLLGTVSIIVFFHTGCKDCQQELPVLQRFYEDYPQYPLICISREEGDDSVSAYWESVGLTMPYSAQTDRKVYQLFARKGIPRIYVINTKGIIQRVFTDSPLASFDDLVEAVGLSFTSKSPYE